MPFSQRFQTQLTWSFSNTRPSEFEMMAMLIGGGSMMMEDDMSLMQCQTSSSGKQQLVI